MLQYRVFQSKLFKCFLAVFVIILAMKLKVFAFTFDTALPYVFLIFLFAILEYNKEITVDRLRSNDTIKALGIALGLVYVLYRYYTFYQTPIYILFWFVLIFTILFLSEIVVPMKKIPKEYIFGALVLAVLSGMGWSFENSQYGDGWRKIFLNIILLSACWYILFVKCFLIVDRAINEVKEKPKINSEVQDRENKANIVKCFLICFVINVILWIPVFLVQYPGVFSSDSVDQMQQILGLKNYSNHHPWYYTLFIGFWYKLGNYCFGSLNAGIATYTLFSIVFVAMCFSAATTFLYRKNVKYQWLIVIEMLYILDPVKAHYATAMWKDVIFSGVILLFCILIAEFNNSKRWMFSFVAIGLAMCLMRNNGIIILLLLFPILFLSWKSNRKQFSIMYVAIMAIYIFLVKIVMPINGVDKTEMVESLSIPLQQIAYTICEDGNINDEEYALIEKVVDTNQVKEEYQKERSDNIKHLVSPKEDYIVENGRQYIELWISIGLKNPYCYLKAFVEQTKGYWYTTEDYPVRVDSGGDGKEIGMQKQPLFIPVNIAEKIAEWIWVYGVQVYPRFYTLGFQTYLCIFICILLKRNKGYWQMVMPGLLNNVTLLLATPLYAELRYAYPLYCFVPLGIGLLMISQSQTGDSSVQRLEKCDEKIL